MTNETESLVGEILRRFQGDMAELRSGQQDRRHRLSLIETSLAGTERNLPDWMQGLIGAQLVPSHHALRTSWQP